MGPFLLLPHGRLLCARSSADAEHGHDQSRLSFLTLQRGNAMGDALRQKSSSRRRVRIGRGASRAACQR
ncbi:hypothetical protein CCL08_04885 [Pseudomonas congelans]|nr:hypothetical protein CCL08_04885 [Pseudomonas congelans]